MSKLSRTQQDSADWGRTGQGLWVGKARPGKAGLGRSVWGTRHSSSGSGTLGGVAEGKKMSSAPSRP